MIRLLNQRDHDSIQPYLDEDHFHNLHLIHALRRHGLESKHATFWGTFKANELTGILCAQVSDGVRFGSLTGNSDKTLSQLGRFAHKAGILTLIGRDSYIIPAIKHLQSWVIQERHYTFYKIEPEMWKGRYGYAIRKATLDDIQLIVEHYKSADYGGFSQTSREEIECEIRRAMQFESGYFMIKQAGQAVSVARIIAETDRAGILDAASTLAEFRCRGMSSCLQTARLEYLFRKGKIGVGYVRDSNSAMHKIMRRCGGFSIGKWLILNLRKRLPLHKRIIPSRLLRGIRNTNFQDTASVT